jgi:hypothetical protein
MSDTLNDSTLEKVFEQDRKNLEQTQVPIITVSASFKEDVKGSFGYKEDETINDVVFSRAHYSMAAGIAEEAWGKEIDAEKAWIVDPTNYVSQKNWGSIELTEDIGKLLARQPLLKKLKDFVDQFGRSKLPILASITPPLMHLAKNIKKPILSFHIASGNILAKKGKTIVQMITDPHVREEYVNNADKENFYLLVFDENTKKEVLEKSEKLGKKVDPNRVIVTGPPIDPRIIAASENKKIWKKGTNLKITLTTGGLGTNKKEMGKILDQLLPELRKKDNKYEVLVYAGTHKDIYDMVLEMAKKEHVQVAGATEKNAKLRVIHHPQIVDANEMLIKYAFPWSDLFISKPSGDMAYDAVACGAALLTLAEWGEWEHNIRVKFEGHEISREADVKHIVRQLEEITNSAPDEKPWVEQAQSKAKTIDEQDKYFKIGAKNILKAYKEIKK